MQKPIYLDNHATTPIDPRVLDAMMPFLKEDFGNSHSTTHCYGWTAEQANETAREQLAKAIGASSSTEIVFTSGATESNNLAIFGVARANRARGNHIISSEIEHKAVLDCLKHLEEEGFQSTILPVDENGQVRLADLEAAIRPETILISIMTANNEIGTINRIAEIGALAKAKNILFHTDAVQAVGRVDVNVERDGIDLLSLSGHKIYGPKGVGALYVRRKNPRVEIEPIIFGGGHERGMRSGTMNTPGIVGLGKAAELASNERVAECARLRELRDRLWTKIQTQIPDAVLNGHPTERLVNNLNISIPYVAGESLIGCLRELAVSSGSACQSGSQLASYVLTAIGRSPELARATIRFGLGRFTTVEEVDIAAEKLYNLVEKLRAANPLYALEKAKATRGSHDSPDR